MGDAAAERAALRARLESYRDDPAGFNRDILGRELWAKQVEVCRAVAASPITVVPAGRAVGKSFLLAGIVLWWLYTRKNSQVITTGPDHRQVVSVLWKEIRRALRGPGSRYLTHTHLTDGYSSPQRLELDSADWGALGFAAKTEEGFGGQHAAQLLVIVDEASGILEPIWSAIHGLASLRLVAVGNPIKHDCHFRELHDLAATEATIATVPISSLECPDADKPSSPVGMASKGFLDQMRAIHGADSPWWRSNILGLFPGAESVRFLPAAWLNACLDERALDDDLWREHPEGQTWIGVDIGGGVGADRSVVVVRNAKRLLDVFASAEHGVLDDAKHRLEPTVIEMARRYGVPPERVVYDRAGLGRSFSSYLANLGFEGAYGYFGAGKGGTYYVNKRTANAFAVRARLDPNREGYVPFYCGGIAEWPALCQELSAIMNPSMEMVEGKVKQAIETKDEIMARLKRSPDVLDAFLMTFTLDRS